MAEEGLRLVKANHEQFIESTKANYQAWGTRLSIDQFVYREEQLLETTLGSPAHHQPWALLRGDTVVASCETFSEDCFYCFSGEKEVRRAPSISVASVFVEDKHRGKGYASIMLRLFNSLMRKQGGYIFSDLYSDVKPTIYERVGWTQYPAPSVAVHVKDFRKSSRFSSNFSASNFGLKDAVSVIKVDEENTKVDVQKAAALHPGAGVVVSHIFSVAKLEWLATIADLYCEVYNYTKPVNYGALIDNHNYIIWSHDFREMDLYVLKLRSTSPENTQHLISAAVAEAFTFRFSHVNIWWNLPSSHASFSGLTIKQREQDSIPMMAWFLDNSKRIDWINIEKFGWV